MALVPRQHVADTEVFSYWCKADRWSAKDFAALYCGLNPFTWEELRRFQPRYTLDDDTRQNIEDVLALINSRLDPLETVLSPREWRALLPRLDLPELDWMSQITQESVHSSSSLEETLTKDRPLGTMERDTLLVIIAALCRECDINPMDRGASVRIREMTETLGCRVDDDTIRGKLKLIPEALESRLNRI